MVAKKEQQEKKSAVEEELSETVKEDQTSENGEIEIEIKDGEEIEEIEAKEIEPKPEESAPERDEEELKLAREYLAQMQMLQADFQNYKKRVEKERLELGKFIKAEFIRKLLPVIDDFERFVESHADSDVISGFNLIHDKLLQMLKTEGLEQITAKGQAFDPNLHDALMTEAVENADDDGKVMEEWEKGYFFQGNLIRAAKVKVGKYTEKSE